MINGAFKAHVRRTYGRRRSERFAVVLFSWVVILLIVTSGAGSPSDWDAVSCCPSLNSDVWESDSLAPGLYRRSHHFDELFGSRQYVNVLTVAPGSPGLEVGVEAARRFRRDWMTVSDFGQRTDAIAAVNGGFAHGGAASSNSGIVKVDGEVISFLRKEPEALRFVGSSAFGIDADGRWHFRDRDGDRWDKDWEDVEDALAAGHVLIRDGEVTQIVQNERFASDREVNHAARRHPRTAVCMTADSTVVLTTVDGRHEEAEGLTLEELSRLLHVFGCHEALNLDGGGSTTMWTLKYGVVNHPSDNEQFDAEGQRLLKTAVVVRYQHGSVLGGGGSTPLETKSPPDRRR